MSQNTKIALFAYFLWNFVMSSTGNIKLRVLSLYFGANTVTRFLLFIGNTKLVTAGAYLLKVPVLTAFLFYNTIYVNQNSSNQVVRKSKVTKTKKRVGELQSGSQSSAPTWRPRHDQHSSKEAIRCYMSYRREHDG